jgi:hypothetical protein
MARVEVLSADADDEHHHKPDDLAEDVEEHQNQPSHPSRCGANMIVGSAAAVVVAGVVLVLVMVMVVVTMTMTMTMHQVGSICNDESEER